MILFTTDFAFFFWKNWDCMHMILIFLTLSKNWHNIRLFFFWSKIYTVVYQRSLAYLLRYFFVQCSEIFFWSKMLRNFENEGKRPCFGLGLVMEMMQNYSTFCDSVVQRLVTHWFTLFITIFWYNWGYLFFKRGTFHSSRVLIVPL